VIFSLTFDLKKAKKILYGKFQNVHLPKKYWPTNRHLIFSVFYAHMNPFHIKKKCLPLLKLLFNLEKAIFAKKILKNNEKRIIFICSFFSSTSKSTSPNL
jgi:hypothetical protein